MATTNTSNNIFNNEMFQNKNLRPYKPFGLNVRVPEATIEKISETVKESVSANINFISNFLATNEDVFNGRVHAEIKSIEHEKIMTSSILSNAEPKVARKFEMHM